MRSLLGGGSTQRKRGRSRSKERKKEKRAKYHGRRNVGAALENVQTYLWYVSDRRSHGWECIGTLGTEGEDGVTPEDDIPEMWAFLLRDKQLLEAAVVDP